MKFSKNLVIATVMVALSAPAFAQTSTTTPATPTIDTHAANQQQRIDAGVANGTLTTQEANTLNKEQQHTANVTANAKADGVMTRGERAKVRSQQRMESRQIARKKHNQRVAPAPAQ